MWHSKKLEMVCHLLVEVEFQQRLVYRMGTGMQSHVHLLESDLVEFECNQGLLELLRALIAGFAN
jgi:hypothetical protein